MALTATMTTDSGVTLTGVYVQITNANVKKFEGAWSTNSDDEREQAANFFKLIYDVEIYKDATAKGNGPTNRIINKHLQHLKIDYNPASGEQNPFKLAYAHLKTFKADGSNLYLSSVSDV